MHRMIFVNLPVADLDRSRAFFAALGYRFDERFSDDRALCLVLGENLYAMLLRREFFAEFTPGPVSESGTEVLLGLSTDSRDAVDRVVEQAVAAGGSAVRAEDHGWMYGRSFTDPDGHVWEIMWMDQASPATSGAATAGVTTG